MENDTKKQQLFETFVKMFSCVGEVFAYSSGILVYDTRV